MIATIYAVRPKSLPQDLTEVEQRHIVGDVIVSTTAATEPTEQCLRYLCARFRIVVWPSDFESGGWTAKKITTWLDAGASVVAVSKLVHLPQELQSLPADRLLLVESTDPLQCPNWTCVLDPTGSLDQLADAFIRTIRFSPGDSPDGELVPTVVCDTSGVALGLAYSNRESIISAIVRRQGVYWSRSRQEIWVKGLSSGATQQLESIDADCDGDAIRFRVRQSGTGFCHLPQRTCFGPAEGSLSAVETVIADRIAHPVAGSYTSRLLSDPKMLRSKIREEADELCAADDPDSTAWEAADLLYFSLVAARQNGIEFQQVLDELARRTYKVTRRPGDAKPEFR